MAAGGPDLATDGQALARRELQGTSSAPAHGSGVIVPGPEECTYLDAGSSPKRIPGQGTVGMVATTTTA